MADETLKAGQDGTATWAEIRKQLQTLAEQRGDWAGYPVPINDLELRLAPSFPYQGLNNMSLDDDTNDLGEMFAEMSQEELKAVLEEIRKLREPQPVRVNSWYSGRFGYEVTIYRDPKTGKALHQINANTPGERLTFALNSLGASRAWDVEPEIRAMRTLRAMIPQHAFDYYVLTGGFLETSPRSKVTYFFRKLRPTIALKCDDKGVRIMNVLCLHPIGHYSNSFAGCMVPTDDVIAHLQMMRGDEHKFWAKANHHEFHSPTSGI